MGNRRRDPSRISAASVERFVWAALMACLPFLTWIADGLGHL